MLSLDEYNKNIFEFLRKKYTHFQVGFFNSNQILFIGQNPGQPFTDKEKNEIKKLSKINKYLMYEKEYTKNWKKSSFGQFVGRIIDNQWNQISFINLIKIPTIQNKQPTQKMLDIFLPITRHQIKLLQPKCVVCFGKYVGNVFNLSVFYEHQIINKIKYILVPHPAFLHRINQIDEGCDKIKQIIQGCR